MRNIPEKVLKMKKEILKEYQEVKCMKPVLDKFEIKRYEYLKNILLKNNAKIYSQKELKTFDGQKKIKREFKVFNGDDYVILDNLYQVQDYIYNNIQDKNELELVTVIEDLLKIYNQSGLVKYLGFGIEYVNEDKFIGNINKNRPILAKHVDTNKKILFGKKQYASEFILDNELQNTDLETRIKGQIRDAIAGKRRSYLGFEWSYYLGNTTEEQLKLNGIELYHPIPKEDRMKTIYKITNTITGEFYIGSTEKSLQDRLYYHKRDYNKPRNVNRKFYNNIKEYGKENFIIEEIEKVNSKDSFKRESYWIIKLDQINNGLNSTPPNKDYFHNYEIEKQKEDKKYKIKMDYSNLFDSDKYTEQDVINEYKKIKCLVPVVKKFGFTNQEQLKKVLIQNNVHIYPQEEAVKNYHNFKNKLNHSKIKMIDEDGNETIFDNIEDCYEYLKYNGITNGKFKSVRQKIRNVINGKKDQFFGLRFCYYN